jgi:GT2 family glycosyltransferase
VVIREPAGAGPAAARNAGVGQTGSELVAFVDADVVVHPDALALLRRALADHDPPDAVFGAYDDSPADPGLVSRFRNLLHHHVHVTNAGPADTFWAGLGAIRRAAFERVGGFDAKQFPEPAIEDIELGARLRADGCAIVLRPEIQGTHLKRWTLASMVRTDFSRRGLPWARLQLATGTTSTALNLSGRHRASALAALVAVGALLARRPRAAAAALGALVALNAGFYALLARRGGLRLAGTGVALHVVHHLTAVAAAATALALGPRRSRA